MLLHTKPDHAHLQLLTDTFLELDVLLNNMGIMVAARAEVEEGAVPVADQHWPLRTPLAPTACRWAGHVASFLSRIKG